MAARVRGGGVALVVVLIVLGGIIVGGRALLHRAQSAVASDGCTFGGYNLNLARSENAATMVGVVIKRRLPERAAVLVLGAALQESKLDNIPAGEGDRDSVGVLQQRPSQGWGSEAQLADVRFATGAFLAALVKVPGWQTAPLAEVVQEVQVSADGSAYARHEAQATTMSDALMGKSAAGVACDFGKPTRVATPATVAAALKAELPVKAPTAQGARLRIPGAGWATAAWLVTHADRFGIDAVSYAGRRWTRSKAWSSDAQAASTEVVATLAGTS